MNTFVVFSRRRPLLRRIHWAIMLAATLLAATSATANPVWSFTVTPTPPAPVPNILTAVQCQANGVVGGQINASDQQVTFVPNVLIGSDLYDYASIADAAAISDGDPG